MLIDIDYLQKQQINTTKALRSLQSDIDGYIESSERICEQLIREQGSQPKTDSTHLKTYDNYLQCLRTINKLTSNYRVELCLNNLHNNNGHSKYAIQKPVVNTDNVNYCTLTKAEQVQFYQNITNVDLAEKCKRFFDIVSEIDSCKDHEIIDSNGTSNNNQLDALDDAISIESGTRSYYTTESSSIPRKLQLTEIQPNETDLNDDKRDECILSLEQKFSFKRKSLTDYKSETFMEYRIAHIEDLNKLCFYVIDPHDKTTISVLKAPLIGEYTDFPQADEVFVVLLDDLPFRAVRSKLPNSKEAFLLELGEIVELTEDDVLLKIPRRFKSIPAQAISCKLRGIYGKKGVNNDVLQEKLNANLHGQAQFYVYNVYENFLELLLVEPPDDSKPESLSNDTSRHPYNEVARELHKHSVNIMKEEVAIPDEIIEEINRQDYTATTRKFGINDLSPADKAMLNEEPLNTTNAMIAAMGYDPQDEKRICRFYNPKTGGCFKGTNCQLLHMPLEPNGWTKDVVVSNSLCNNNIRTLVYKCGEIINITPTHIIDNVRFYAQVNDNNSLATPLIWHRNEIPDHVLLKNAPQLFDLVRARFPDNNWYRAQVKDCTESRQLFKVFYLDYGNELLVPLCDLAKFDAATVRIPAEAKIFKIANLRNATTTIEDQRECLSFLSDKILNKNIDVKVLEQIDEEVFIGFIGNLCNLKKQLIKKGYAEPTNCVYG